MKMHANPGGQSLEYRKKEAKNENKAMMKDEQQVDPTPTRMAKWLTPYNANHEDKYFVEKILCNLAIHTLLFFAD